MDDINLIRNEKGTTAVEMAIIFLLLLTFIFGIIEFGLLIFNKQILTDASREGARVGVVLGRDRSCVNPPEPEYVTDSKQKALDYLADHLVTFGTGVPSLSVNYSDLNGDGCPSGGDDLIVSISYNYEFLILSAFKIIDYPITLDAVTKMKFE